MFLQKGADVVMANITPRNDWLGEEIGNMAREGLGALVMAKEKMNEQSYESFEGRHHAASVKLDGRNEVMTAIVIECLEKDLELLGLTCVGDKLQDEVKSTLELLRNAGIKIWMLTGDKIETATCIAISTKLVARNQYIHQVAKRGCVLRGEAGLRLIRFAHLNSQDRGRGSGSAGIPPIEIGLLSRYRRGISPGQDSGCQDDAGLIRLSSFV